jgi:hypothetical protein
MLSALVGQTEWRLLKMHGEKLKMQIFNLIKNIYITNSFRTKQILKLRKTLIVSPSL